MSSGTAALRVIAIALGVGLLFFAYKLHTQGLPLEALWILILDGALIVGGTIFERGRYKPKIDLESGKWTETGENFQDPTTGKLMKVVFNPATGERDYVEI